MLTKTMGSLVGTPLMTVLWVNAIKLDGIGIGLPYFVSAVSHDIDQVVRTDRDVVYLPYRCTCCHPLEPLIHEQMICSHRLQNTSNAL